jgi:hypothetical protein
MALVAVSEVSDITKNGEETLGMERTGRRVKVCLIVWKASSQAGVQFQWAFFLVRLEGTGDIGEVGNKPAVEVAESYK